MASFKSSLRFCCPLPKLTLAFLLVTMAACWPAIAQENAPRPSIDQLISAGEFPAALEKIESMPAAEADQLRLRVAERQLELGAPGAAFLSLRSLQDAGVVGGLQFGQDIAADGNAQTDQQPGQQGGITEADFQPLIDLIQSVIGSDTWEDAGGEGSLMAYPAGVYVDTSGILQRLKPIDAQKNARRRSVRKKLAFNGKLEEAATSPLRKISLKRLLREVNQATTFGRVLDASIQNMAGVYKIQYVIVDQNANDIVLAGPGGPWKTDASGQAVNRATGAPVLRLDDLLVCLKNACASGEERGKFGCTIVPRQKGLAAAAKFLSTTKLTGKRWADELRDAVGRQDVEVSGIDPDSHAAAVIVEADLLMKMIGMGTEPSIPAVPDYFDRVAGQDQTGQRDSLVRWWFTVDLNAITTDPDRNFFELSGSTVKVLSENEHLSALGQRVHSGQSDAATEGFAQDFTDNFDELSQVYPVFAKLKNVFDLALVAGIIHQFELDQKVGLGNVLESHFRASTVAGKPAASISYWPGPLPFSTEVESIVNYRKVSFSKAGKRYRQQLVAVSGGVEFDFDKAIAKSSRTDESQSAFPIVNVGVQERDFWWWD